MAMVVWADDKPADVPPPEGKDKDVPPSPPQPSAVEGKPAEGEKKEGDRQGRHLWWGPRWVWK